MTKNTKIAIGVVAAAGLGYLLWTKSKKKMGTQMSEYEKCNLRNAQWIEKNRLDNNCQKQGETRDICFAIPPENCDALSRS